jgi:hypothetical protein
LEPTAGPGSSGNGPGSINGKFEALQGLPNFYDHFGGKSASGCEPT